MPIPILVYTHSDYSFLWKAAIPLLTQYAKGFEIIWCCDSLANYTLPPNWRVYTYDPSLIWSERVKGCLETIDSEYREVPKLSTPLEGGVSLTFCTERHCRKLKI